jgi:hypothetical protein
MATADIMPPPNLKQFLQSPTKLAQEQAAFRRLLPELLAKYRSKFVAIHEEKIVGVGDDLVTVALAAYERYGYQPIYVDFVTDEPTRPVRIPHFKPIAQ